MSTKLGFKQPKDLMVFTTDEDCLTVEYSQTKVKDGKQTRHEYSAYWTLSSLIDDTPRLIGCLRAPIYVENDEEGVEGRVKELANYAAEIIFTAAASGVGGVLEKSNKREIVVATHARWHSQYMSGLLLEEAMERLGSFVKAMGVKNVKKVLSEVVDARISYEASLSLSRDSAG